MTMAPHRFFAVLAFTMVFIAGALAPAHASCRYFRIGSKLLECKEESAEDLKALARPETELPELPAPDDGKLMHVRCSCDYTYYGSNPLCDSSQTQEIESAMGTDNKANPCAEAKTFCGRLCPQNFN